MKKIWLLGAAALLVPLGACGSSDGGGSTDDTPTTTAAPEADEIAFDDWVDEVNTICADSRDAIDELGEPADYAELATMSQDAADLVDEAREEIDELGTPDDNQDQVEEWLGLLDDQSALYPEVIAAAEDEDEDALTEVSSQIEDIQSEAREIAADLGLDECAKDDAERAGEDTTATDETGASDLTFDEWVVAADAVCADFEAASDELSANFDETTTLPEYGEAFEAVIPLYGEFLDALAALGVPADAPPELEEWLDLISEAPDRIQPLADAALADDEEAFTELSDDLESYDQQINDAATALGFEECSQA